MQRRTKIVATIGPASASEDTLRAMLVAGVNVLRFNFSHPMADFEQYIAKAREIAAELHSPLAIMADLQGPKIRVGQFEFPPVQLQEGQIFTLHCAETTKYGNHKGVAVDYLQLPKKLNVGDRLLLDDGLIELEVTKITQTRIICLVIEGGFLGNNKGLNRRGGGLLNDACLTEKDKLDMKAALQAGVDYLTLSFVQSAEDIHRARTFISKLGNNIPIIAKIECCEALAHLTEIIHAADAVMVARGDLAVEVGAAEVPAIQKQIIEQTRQLNKVVITATQMMESMIHNPMPTRAEVSDVANAILDGSDAVMLSAETASGDYPVKVVAMVDKICRSAEKHAAFYYQGDAESCHYKKPDHAIAMASMHISNHFPLSAIVALTESGSTAIWMSRIHSAVPIYAVSANERTVRKLSLVNNVFPVYFDYRDINEKILNQTILNYMINSQRIAKNTFILFSRGRIIGAAGGTNTLEIIHTGLT